MALSVERARDHKESVIWMQHSDEVVHGCDEWQWVSKLVSAARETLVHIPPTKGSMPIVLLDYIGQHVKRESLEYRKLSLNDLPLLQEIMLNASHMRYSTRFADEEQCEHYIQTLSLQWEANGFGCWTMVEKTTREVVGWGGIVIDEYDQGWGPELIYYVSPKKTGLGYASEVAEFSVKFGFSEGALKRISAFAHPSNIASNRVLRKAGFQRSRYIVRPAKLINSESMRYSG